MIEVRKRESEKFEALLRRFNRVVQDSGLLRTVKESRYYSKPLSRGVRRQEATRKSAIKKVKNIRFTTKKRR